MDATAIDSRIAALERCVNVTEPVGAQEQLRVGVDLGTASIVLVVLNAAGQSVACAMEYAQVVKDGLVVDYVGATRIVRRLVEQLEARLGRQLRSAAIAVPPGTGAKDCATHSHVVQGAGLEVTAVVDEPTAANAVLGVVSGVIVDIGGGTTGLSILENGRVVYVADEPTGGTHLTLVLAGNYHISFEEAEALKKQADRQDETLAVVRPVIQKMGTIVATHIKGRDVESVYLVGGTCCLKGMETVIAQVTGKPVYKPRNPCLVTPLGIALHACA
jgi:ethanolamine utilization protein EutJ